MTYGDLHVEIGTLDSNLVSHFRKMGRAWNKKTSPNLPPNLLKSTLGASGRLGQALERLNCVLDAFWERLGENWRPLEANLRRLGGFLGRLEGVLGALGTSQASF